MLVCQFQHVPCAARLYLSQAIPATSSLKIDHCSLIIYTCGIMSDPLIGKHLGSFEILEAIGQGGMATVYKARQSAMNRSVALKVLSTPMANNPAFLARFKQEAEMIAALEHTHILPVYDMGEQDGYVFIAMRYMSHGTLTSRIAQGPVPL